MNPRPLTSLRPDRRPGAAVRRRVYRTRRLEGNPDLVMASILKRGLARSPDSWRSGVCRRIDPQTGQVIGLIDPWTREETKPS